MSRTYTEQPPLQLKDGARYEALVQTTEGNFTMALLPAQAPVTVNSFVTLSRDGFYDGVIFHRVIESFVIQTGDPTGTGMGGPGYQFADELPPALPYGPGVVAMANAGPNTNGSQFFVCTGESSASLNDHPNYTVFGRVIDGMDTVLKIAATPVARSSSGERSKPVEDIQVESITIQETSPSA